MSPVNNSTSRTVATCDCTYSCIDFIYWYLRYYDVLNFSPFRSINSYFFLCCLQKKLKLTPWILFYIFLIDPSPPSWKSLFLTDSLKFQLILLYPAEFSIRIIFFLQKPMDNLLKLDKVLKDFSNERIKGFYDNYC